MEKAKKRPKKTKSSIGLEEITRRYIEYVLENRKRPSSVFIFCKSIGISEDEFYKYNGSFKALDKAIWKGYVNTAIERLSSDDNYLGFSVREKVLAFYFTLVEVLKKDRSYVIHQINKWKLPSLTPDFILKFKKVFDAWANEIIEEGKVSEEIAKRPFIDKQYGPVLWFHLQFLLQFWSRDESPDFEKTDEAIEKSVNLAFDLMGKGVVDNAFEFGKFLFQQKKN